MPGIVQDNQQSNLHLRPPAALNLTDYTGLSPKYFQILHRDGRRALLFIISPAPPAISSLSRALTGI
jgi:hypothetical protein